MNIELFFLQNSDLKKDEKLLLLFLGSRSFRGEGVFHAPLKHLSLMTGISSDVLKTSLVALSEKKRLAYDFENEICWVFDLLINPVFLQTKSIIYGLARDIDQSNGKELCQAYEIACNETIDSLDRLNKMIGIISVENGQPIKRGRGRPPKNKGIKPLVTSKPEINQSQDISNSNQPETEKQFPASYTLEPGKAKRPRKSKSIGDEAFTEFFNEFWDAYPRKEAKAEAVKAAISMLKKAKGDIALAELKADILHGSKAYRDYVELSHVEKQYIKLGSSWLRAERWEDHKKGEVLSQQEKDTLENWHNQFVRTYPKKIETKKTKMAFMGIKDKVLNEPNFAESMISAAKAYAQQFVDKENFALSPDIWIEREMWNYENQIPQNNGLQSTMLSNNFEAGGFESTISMGLIDDDMNNN